MCARSDLCLYGCPMQEQVSTVKMEKPYRLENQSPWYQEKGATLFNFELLHILQVEYILQIEYIKYILQIEYILEIEYIEYILQIECMCRSKRSGLAIAVHTHRTVMYTWTSFC